MFRVLCLFLFLLTIAGAEFSEAETDTAQQGQEIIIPLESLPPHKWGSDRLKFISSNRLDEACSVLRSYLWSARDRVTLEHVFRLAGFNASDIIALRNPSTHYQTGQTFAGFLCKVGKISGIKKSLHKGVGHRWQVELGRWNYVYFEGNGEDLGMFLTGWN